MGLGSFQSTSSIVILSVLVFYRSPSQVDFVGGSRHLLAGCPSRSPDWCWRPVGSTTVYFPCGRAVITMLFTSAAFLTSGPVVPGYAEWRQSSPRATP